MSKTKKGFDNSASMLFHLEGEEKARFLALIDRLNERVESFNQDINDAQGGGVGPSGKPKGHTLFASRMTQAKVNRWLVQRLLEQYEDEPDALMAELDPRIGVALGVLDRAEALRGGLISLTAEDITSGLIDPAEVPPALLVQLGLDPDDPLKTV